MAVRTWAQLRAAFADNNTGDITAGDLRDLVDTLEEQASRRISIRVAANGVPTTPTGQKPIAGSNPSTGTFMLTCPSGFVWQSATAVGNNPADHRSVNIAGGGTDTLEVSVTTRTGTPVSVSFYLTGTLAPA